MITASIEIDEENGIDEEDILVDDIKRRPPLRQHYSCISLGNRNFPLIMKTYDYENILASHQHARPLEITGEGEGVNVY